MSTAASGWAHRSSAGETRPAAISPRTTAGYTSRRIDAENDMRALTPVLAALAAALTLAFIGPAEAQSQATVPQRARR